MTPILDVQHLAFSFNKQHPILSDISFTLHPGEFAVLGGRNGTGKSLLMRCIKGLLQPTEGHLTIDGIDLTRKPRARNEAVGLVFQDADTQMVGQTVERDILFGLENLGLPLPERQRRLDEVVQLLDLKDLLQQRPRTLSGGERRRLAIAGVFVMKPHVLLLDEPFANLDFPGVVRVLQSLITLHELGTTILVATHEIEKILAHTDSLLLIDEGRIGAQGKPEQVIEVVEDYGIRRPSILGNPIAVKELTWLR